MTRTHSALILVAAITFISPALAQDYLSGATLYGDVKRYDSFGIHRYGTGGAEAAFDWITERLRAEELVVENQDYRLGRQYFLDEATLTARGKTIPVVPQWWMPEDMASSRSLRQSSVLGILADGSCTSICPMTMAPILTTNIALRSRPQLPDIPQRY